MANAAAHARESRSTSEAARPLSTPTTQAGANYPLQVGQCVTAAEITSLMVLGGVPCDSEMSSYELAFKGDQTVSCPDGKRNDSVYTVLAKADTTLCFTYNLIEGKCYVDGDTTPPAFTISSCGAPKAVRVIRRIDNGTSPAECPSQSTAVVFPQPARVFCLAAP
jgi:hypothetical protein